VTGIRRVCADGGRAATGRHERGGPRSPGRTAATALLAAGAVIALASCGGDGGSTGSGPVAPSWATVPPPATTYAGVSELPSGWERDRTEGFSYGLPPGIRRLTDRRVPGASATYLWPEDTDTGTGEQTGGLPPVIAVFVEPDQTTPLMLRTTLVTERRNQQLGTTPVGPPQVVVLPGGTATVTEWRWDHRTDPDSEPVPRRQIEVIVETTGTMHYGVLFGGPPDTLTDEVVATFLGSLRVTTPEPEGEPSR
jgi:hypothetical protein